jgi:hypothetical protein
VLVIVSIFVLSTIVVAAVVIVPWLTPRRIIFDLVPDRPHAFGYKMAWLAVRSSDTAAVAEELGLGQMQAANWESGLGTIYDDRLGTYHVFVSPPVEGWTFVAGLSLPAAMGARFVDKLSPLLVKLGQRFGEVNYHFSYPAIDAFAWARVRDGTLVRAFGITDEGVVWQEGKVTREEHSLGLKKFELRGVKHRRGDAGGEILLYPTEAHVLALAGAWGIDPTTLDARSVSPALGIIGRTPVRWLPERQRKAA